MINPFIMQSEPRSHAALQWVRGSKQHRNLALASNFLSADDIEALHCAAKHPSVKEIHDRKSGPHKYVYICIYIYVYCICIYIDINS